MVYEDFKDLNRRTVADKVLRDKPLNIAKNSKYDGYELDLASMVDKFFDKKTSIYNKELIEELQKTIIRKFNKGKGHSFFTGNIWGADFADMQLISKLIKVFKFLLCVIDIDSKYAWVIPLKDQKGIAFTNAFQKFANELNRKSNKIWVDKGSKFYNRSMK